MFSCNILEGDDLICQLHSVGFVNISIPFCDCFYARKLTKKRFERGLVVGYIPLMVNGVNTCHIFVT